MCVFSPRLAVLRDKSPKPALYRSASHQSPLLPQHLCARDLHNHLANSWTSFSPRTRIRTSDVTFRGSPRRFAPLSLSFER